MPADIVNASELQSMETDLQNWYNHTCNITRYTKTADQYGGQSNTPTVIASGVKCDVRAGVQTLRTTEEIGSQVESRLTYTISLPPATDIRIHDHITITSSTPNRDLVVAAVMQPESYDIELLVVATMEGEPIV